MESRPHRQGDILFIPVDSIPDGVKPVERDSRGRIVLAEGERTGHAHCILEDSATLFAPADLDEMADRFLAVERDHIVDAPIYEERETGSTITEGSTTKVNRKVTKSRSETHPVRQMVQTGTVRAEGVLVTHEEHRIVHLEPGNWIVRRKREYQPERPRMIAD